MTLFDCVRDAMDEGSMRKEFGKKAQARFTAYAKMLRNEGKPGHVADQMAADRVREELARETAAKRREEQARLGWMVERQGEIMAAGRKPDSAAKMNEADFEARSIESAARARLGRFLERVRTNVLSRSRDPEMALNTVRAVIEGKSDSPLAAEFAKDISETFEWLRLMANQAGASIGKMDGYFPVEHNRTAIMRAGYVEARPGLSAKQRLDSYYREFTDPLFRKQMEDRAFGLWSKEITGRLAWEKMTDPATGRGFAPETSPQTKSAYLRWIFDNLLFGKSSLDAQYGRPQGEAAWRRLSQERVLQWKSADDWVAYNKRFGSGDPMRSLMNHINGMANDIAMMREFGPTPGLGVDFSAQLWSRKARDNGDTRMLGAAEADRKQAQAMLRVMSGAAMPTTRLGEVSMTFFATARQVLSASLLERAVTMAAPDFANAQMAAKMIGADPNHPLKLYLRVAQGLSREELLRLQWVHQTWADPGVNQARFSQEMGAQPWAQTLNNASMRIQGLSWHTDELRQADYLTFSGQMAAVRNKSFADLPDLLRQHLQTHRITSEDWDRFRSGDVFTAESGATFLAPNWWRANRPIDDAPADDLFLKFQSAAEHMMEVGTPTRGLYADAIMSPEGWAPNLTRGDLRYEIFKSMTMFKRFVGAMTTNMAYNWRLRPTTMSRWAYAAEHVARATVFAALSIQIRELISGRDPQDMSDPQFWTRALFAGGGLAIAGDLILTGTTSWGGGYGAYLTGPLVAASGDAMALTFGNLSEVAAQWMAGEQIDTNLIPEARRFADRYLIPEPPFIGPAFDRMILDQMQIYLDPASREALLRTERSRENRIGNEAWWLPGEAMPARAPSLEGQGAFWRQ